MSGAEQWSVRMIINIKLESSHFQTMHSSSLQAFSKIHSQMDRLSSLMAQQDNLRHQLQGALFNERQSSSSSEENIEAYLKEYDNPTTKSIPFEEEPPNASPSLQEDSQTINTIYRTRGIEESEEDDRGQVNDDKSTVILAGLTSIEARTRKEQPQKQPFLNGKPLPSRQQKNKKHTSSMKKKPEIAPVQMPQETNFSLPQKGRKPVKSSVPKGVTKVESPSFTAARKTAEEEAGHSRVKEFRSGVSKVSKIDGEELNKLQQKRAHKKTELSSNRRKTKRGELRSAKSTTNIAQGKMVAASSSISRNIHTYSSKAFPDSHKRTTPKEKVALSHEWHRSSQKAMKKLNRVNIVKLQENLKKTHEKKLKKEPSHKKTDKLRSKDDSPKRGQGLKLHFTQTEEETEMVRLIAEKGLEREHERQTGRYLEAADGMSRGYFTALIKECRETSEEAIFKLKLMTLLLHFFEQFSSQALLSCLDSAKDPLGATSEEEIIEVLLHPARLKHLIDSLPAIVLHSNTLSAQRTLLFSRSLADLNDELDLELEFFLIKKTPLFCMVHAVSEYLTFLTDCDLVRQTRRSRVVEGGRERKVEGFYSNRSKKDELSRRYLKRKEGPYRSGFRCDSDRKIALEEDELVRRVKAEGKACQLRRLFK